MAQKRTPKPLPSLEQISKPKRPSLLWSILVGVLLLSLCLLGLVLITRRPWLPLHVTGGGNTIHILFIGKSYTYVNNLPGLLIELSAHESKPVDAEMVAGGGARLADHWAQGKALAAIQRSRWDYVVLQEQSELGVSFVQNSINPTTFHQSVRLFNTEIQKVGAKTLLYLTWSRQDAPQNQSLLTKAYMDIARELHILVAPVGPAWQKTVSVYPSTPLYQDDGSHPDSIGSYLAACVFYATIYQKSPEGLPARISNTLVDDDGNPQSGDVKLNPADAHALQQIAWQVVSAQ
ncbi:MAG: SGNH/GDSL hydrolase family protein [Anaerolineae bacterium]|nr:SGNH/GDSL hydrolase family protein [Anaerolineae bacterium]